MLKDPVCIVPQWKELKWRLIDKLELQKGLPESSAGTTLSDRPIIIFRSSSFPSLMPLIGFYSINTRSYFASFTWKNTKGSKNKVRLWIYNSEDDRPVSEKDYAMEEDPKVVNIIYISCRHLFVAYCDDIHLRFFSDHRQNFKLLSAMSSPYVITSMCYNPEMDELVTGAIGVVVFWSFIMEEAHFLGMTQEMHIVSGEFVQSLRVEQERRALVVLCENIIRVFDYQTKAEIRTFQVIQGVSLTCFSANWLQGLLYTGDMVGDIKVWNFDTGSQSKQFKAHLSAITTMVKRVSVHTLMTASLDGLLKEWNLTTCELIRRVDIGEPLLQLQFINEQTFFLQTQHTFSIRTLNNFYQLFNKTKSILKNLVRVQCGPDKARILATTEDGVIRFLSPVTGEMLFVTWPFQMLEKALDYVYDPEREELLVTMGTTDIYVLDTTKNPCPAKYILRTTESMEDKVLCLAYSRLDLGGHTVSFIFSGYKSGKVRTVTQHLYRMRDRRLHDGNVMAISSLSAAGNLSYHSRESSYLCSYGSDEYIILSDVILKKNHFLEIEPLVVIPSTNCRINHLLLIPGYICVLTEQNRVRLWSQADLVPGKKNPFWKESDVMHPTSITSFDYCHTLSMLVTGGADGSIRIWDILGQMLVEFDTSLKFSRVCFANQCGDLLVGCNKNIYFISCVTYLPTTHVRMLSDRCLKDDVVERPLPFLPHFLLSFNIVFVPKYRQVGKQAKKYERLEPITNNKEVVIEKNVARVMEFCGKEACLLPSPDFYGIAPSIKEKYPEFSVEYKLIQQPSFQSSLEMSASAEPHHRLPPLAEGMPVLRRIPIQHGHLWPIAPDGYIPNSVIRAELFQRGTPLALPHSLHTPRQVLPLRKVFKIQLEERTDSERIEKARKKKAQKAMQNTFVSAEVQHHRDLLAEIVTKPWLRHKPSEINLPCVVKTILDLIDDVPYTTYLLCTSALVQISEAYMLPPEVKKLAFARLIQDTKHKEARMRLAAWETLGKMNLLTDTEVVSLAQALLDENNKVRNLARSLLDSVAGITDKFVLKKEVQRLTEGSEDDLTSVIHGPEDKFSLRVHEKQHEAEEGALWLMNRVEDQLNANLFLMNEHLPTQTRLIRPPHSRRRFMPQGKRDSLAEKTKQERRGSLAEKTKQERRGSLAEKTKQERRGSLTEKTKQERMDSLTEKNKQSMGSQARWLGPAVKHVRKPPQSSNAFDVAKRLPPERLPKMQLAPEKVVIAAKGSDELLAKSSSSSSSSSSTSTSSSSSSSSSSAAMSHAEQPAKTFPRTRGKQLWLKASESLPQKAQRVQTFQKLPKLGQPIILQQKDSRTQVYREMPKHQLDKKRDQHARKEQEGVTVDTKQPKPSKLTSPLLPPVTSRGSLIDPKEQYSTDTSTWRRDLLKLLMLRIAPSPDMSTVIEDLVTSARRALSGHTMSLASLLVLCEPILTSQEQTTPELERQKELLKPFVRELLSEVSSKTKVFLKEEGQPISKNVIEKPEGPGSLEDRAWEVEETEEEKTAMRKKQPESGVEVSKQKIAASQKRWRKAMIKTKKKGAGRGEEIAKEEEEEVLQSKELAKGKELETAKAKGREVAKGKEQEAVKGKGLEVAKGKGLEAAKGKGPEAAKGKGPEAAKGKGPEAAMGKGQEAAMGKEEEAAMEKGQEAAVGKGQEAAVGKGEEAAVGKGEEAAVGKGQEAAVGKGQEAAVGKEEEAAVGKGEEAAVGKGEEAAVGKGQEAAVGKGEEAAVGKGEEAAVGKGEEAAVGKGQEAAVGKGEEAAVGKGEEAAVGKGQEAAVGKGEEAAVGKGQEAAVGKGEEAAVGKEEEAAVGKGEEAAVGKGEEAAVGKEEEAAVGKGEEAAVGKEEEAAVGKGQEAAVGKGEEAAVGKEQEAAMGKEGEEARKWECKAVERKTKEVAMRIRVQAEMKTGELAGMKEEMTEEKEETLAKVIEEVVARAKKRALVEASERVVAEVTSRALAGVREKALAHAQEMTLAEALEKALAEAREIALAEAREMALTELKSRALDEMREELLEEAKGIALAEAWERDLAAVQNITLAGEREKVLAEAKLMVLSEGKGEILAAARIKEQAEVRAMEMARARAMELVKERETKVDEARVLELTARAMELAEEREMELAEASATELAEARLWELVEEKIKQVVEAKAEELAVSKLREVDLEEERQTRERLTFEREEADLQEAEPDQRETGLHVADLRKTGLQEPDLWEAGLQESELQGTGLREAGLWKPDQQEAGLWKTDLQKAGLQEADLWDAGLQETDLQKAGLQKTDLWGADLQEDIGIRTLSKDEREALVAMWEEEHAQDRELDFPGRAQLLLDTLTKPEKLEVIDSKTYQHLFQVASLLQFPPTADAKELADALLQKTEEILKEGREKQEHLSKESTFVLMKLKEAMEAHQPWYTNVKKFEVNIRTLLKTALSVLRAQTMKEQLTRDVKEKSWWKKAEKEWKEGDSTLMSKRAWLDKMVRITTEKWQAKQERAEKERLEQRHKEKRLQLRSQPIMLGMRKRGKDREKETEKEREEEKSLKRVGPQAKLMWSIGLQREGAWKAIVEEPHLDHIPRLKRQKLPDNYLYIPTEPSKQKHRRELKKGTRQHIFRLNDKEIDWDKFTKFYQTLVSLKGEEEGTESAAWQENSSRLLDLYGLSNPVIRGMTQQLLMGDHRQRKCIRGKVVNLSEAEANLGQRVLYELVQHSTSVLPRPPTLHSIIPLSYQNNVHSFKPQGIARFGTMLLKWKTLSKRKRSKLCLYVDPRGHAK